MTSRLLPTTLATTLVLLAAAAGRANDLEGNPIRYSETAPDNVVSRLQQKIDAGEIELDWDEEFGYLPSLLESLDVPRSSQALVFSKTSLQRSRISPRRPRALYFNDDVYVGYCQNGDVVELSAADTKVGTAFYTLAQTDVARPRIERRIDGCLICHASSHTGNVPGHVVRSVFPDAGGFPKLASGTYRIDHTSPFERRWGGWYVTGTHGDQKHLGNHVYKSSLPRDEPNDGLNLTDLSGRFSTAKYLTPHSDIVSLLVLEHQTTVHNALVKAGFATREALWYEKSLDEALGDSPDELRESTRGRIENAGEKLLRCLLLCGEAPLTARVKGTSKFAEEYAARGPFDREGRSLRTLDLQTRLFRYPCSPLVGSEAFDELPDVVRDHVLRRMHDVLTGKDQSEEFDHLTPETRREILEILVATKPSLPATWRR